MPTRDVRNLLHTTTHLLKEVEELVLNITCEEGRAAVVESAA
jgi:hypothetical protein